MEKLFDIGQPVWQLLVVVLFLVPGLNTTWAIERFAGPLTLRPTERLVRAVASSVLVYLLASPLLVRIFERLRSGSLSVWEPILSGGLLLFAVPILLGILWARIRRSKVMRRLVRKLSNVDPAPAAWDFAFREQEPMFVRVRLRDGDLVGGLFGTRSFASAHPQPPDIFIEEAWRLDRRGSFIAPMAGSKGLLVPHEMIALVESFRAVEVRDG